MKSFVLALFAIAAILHTAHGQSQKIVKDSISSEGKKRTYYLFVPDDLAPAPAPLIVLLHGSNRNGLSLVEKWKALALKEKIVLVGPDSTDSAGWNMPRDGPLFIYDLVEALKSKYKIDPRRVYLFGHSAGATFALLMSLYESEYFAGTAIHAGALEPQYASLIDQPKRKIPIFIQVGTNDPLFPLSDVRATRDALVAKGFPVQLTEIPNHDHWYYDLAPKINLAAWEFLKKQELAAEPRYDAYRFLTGAKSKESTEAFNRAMVLQRAGDLKGAIAAYSRAIEVDPKFSEAYANRGVALVNRQDYAAAIADLTISLNLKPTEVAYYHRGVAYHSLKKTREAMADFTKAIELNPSAASYLSRAVVEDENGNADAAVQDLTRAMEIDPKLAQARANRGIIFLRLGKYEEAQRDFDEALKLDASLRQQLEPAFERLRAKRPMN
jgi:predicted esterase/Flp pilus assembly protein TadD